MILGISIAVTNKHKCSIHNMDMERSFLDHLWIKKKLLYRGPLNLGQKLDLWTIQTLVYFVNWLNLPSIWSWILRHTCSSMCQMYSYDFFSSPIKNVWMRYCFPVHNLIEPVVVSQPIQFMLCGIPMCFSLSILGSSTSDSKGSSFGVMRAK